MLLLGPDFRIRAVSDAYLKATLTEREAILGRDLFDVFPDNPEEKDATGTSNLRASLLRVLATGSTDPMPIQKYDVRDPKNDGKFELKYWLPTNIPILDSSRRVQYILHQVTDVTETTLRTAERDRLETERNSREEFVALLSHDLRNPLSAASTGLQFLKRIYQGPSQGVTLLEQALTSLRRADRMITDLLDSNRIQSGMTDALHPKETDLREFILEVTTTLETQFGNRFELDLEEEVRGFWSQDGLRRAIENLVSNAVKYGSSDLPISITAQAKGAWVEILVHNHGSELSPEEQATIFDPYRRGRIRETQGKQGWGLGLTQVRNITQAHGGVVRAECEPGQGVTFRISVPRDSRPFLRPVEKQTSQPPPENNGKLSA